MEWPKDRREELSLLIDMLQDLRLCNNGSGFMERVGRSIQAANELTSSSLSDGRESFVQFLISQAVGGE